MVKRAAVVRFICLTPMKLQKPIRAFLDYETRSTVDLRKQGLYRYAADPSTEILCAAYRLPHWSLGKVALWTPEYPDLGIYTQGGDFDELFEFFAWIEQGGLVESHNAAFERHIWGNISGPTYGWPEIPLVQWRCSAAQAAAVALPRGLDDALAAMRLALRKDEPGSKVMKKMTKPRKARKAEREAWQTANGNKPMKVLYHEDRHLLDQLFDYVRQDVLAEEGLSYVLPDLSPDELEIYQLDQVINDRGFQLDMEAVSAALYLLQEEAADLNAELGILTEGQVERATQRDRMKVWLDSEGLCLDDTQAATLDALLADWPVGASDKAKRAVEILRTLGRSSTSKYEAMALRSDPADGRARGTLLYHGAGTGRFSGLGVMPHNFPKGTLKEKDVGALWDTLKTLDRPLIRSKYSDVLVALSHGLRSAITASPGHQLYCADYSSIEARVILWLAGDTQALEVFQTGQDIYCYFGESIYGRPITKLDVTERQISKVAVLGLGFGMGWQKFGDTLLKAGIEAEESFVKLVVDRYRQKFALTKQFWYDTEAAAIQAVKTKRPVEQGPLRWTVEQSFLMMELPSGRKLSFPFPSVSMQETSWGAQKETLSFKGVNPKTRQWQTQRTYGGSLAENAVQACARDIMAAALLRVERHGLYLPVLSVHDEVVAEAPEGAGSVAEFEQLMTVLPEWADGLPVAAEGWTGFRYKKG